MPWKITLLFSGKNYLGPAGGWSETYYSNVSNETDAASRLSVLALRRINILTPAYSLDFGRISDALQPRAAKLKRLDYPGGYVPSSGAGQLKGQLWAASLVTLYTATPGVKRKIMMRGVPMDILSPQGGTTNNDTRIEWTQRQSTFLNGLPELGIMVRAKDRSPVPPTYPIQDVNWGEDTTGLQLSNVVGLTLGMKVHLYNLRGFEGLSGDRIIRGIVPTSNTVQVDTLGAHDGRIKGSPYLFPVKYSYIPMTTSEANAITHRDTGRPSGPQRGRQVPATQ